MFSISLNEILPGSGICEVEYRPPKSLTLVKLKQASINRILSTNLGFEI